MIKHGLASELCSIVECIESLFVNEMQNLSKFRRSLWDDYMVVTNHNAEWTIVNGISRNGQISDTRQKGLSVLRVQRE